MCVCDLWRCVQRLAPWQQTGLSQECRVGQWEARSGLSGDLRRCFDWLYMKTSLWVLGFGGSALGCFVTVGGINILQ